MAVYRKQYRDKGTGRVRQSRIWWYDFTFAGRRVQESSKSTRKTIAVEAEKKRRLELERGFNHVKDNRRERIRSIAELATEFHESYKLRNARSATFAHYALGHVKRLLGTIMVVDVTEVTIKNYQTTRLKEAAAPKSINEEVGFLLRILSEQGDFLRAKLRRQKMLKLTTGRRVARAYTPAEKIALLAAAKQLRSRAIYPSLMLALHAGMRDAEIRTLQWDRLDLQRAILTVGDSKTEAGEGRTIPLNADLIKALQEHAEWYQHKFGEIQPAWYVFPFGQPQPTDPARPATTFKTAWAKVKKIADVKGRWHDNRHTFITDLAEGGEASDETIQDLAGHVSKQMLRHYSHIRMQAKRRAVDSLVRGERPEDEKSGSSAEPPKVSPKVGRSK